MVGGERRNNDDRLDDGDKDDRQDQELTGQAEDELPGQLKADQAIFQRKSGDQARGMTQAIGIESRMPFGFAGFIRP